MDDVELMQIGDSTDDLLEEPTGVWLIQLLHLDYQIEQFSLLHILHHQKEILRSFDNLDHRESTS